MRRSSPLDAGWHLLVAPDARARLGTPIGEVAATVPGCVHTDLLAAGLIADPLIDQNDLDQRWIGELDWTYRLEFDTNGLVDDDRLDLVFEGLDTFATVRLNGDNIGCSENQHRTYRFDARRAVRAGSNELVVHFRSAAVEARARRVRVGDLPNPYGEPYNFVRKMACNFGWDWGPQLVTAGIWRAVTVERWTTARLARVRPVAVVAHAVPGPAEVGRVEVEIELERACGHADTDIDVRMEVRDADGMWAGGGEVTTRGSTCTIHARVDDIVRWWPIGRGDQPLYEVVLTMSVGDEMLDRVIHRTGFRHVELDTSPDIESGDGSMFALVVNGERVWVRGFNWIPDDCFPSRVGRDRVARRIDQAVDANANLLRVWGGGLYESDDFYASCDERGMLVWQDFLFSCAAYPEELLCDEVEAEAIDNVTRLAPHPSLVVWCGNNENLMGWADWGWPELVGERSWGAGFYREMLPEILGRLDPNRPYIDGSPTSMVGGIHPNDDRYGAVHLWDVWNDHNYDQYRSHAPRFVSEFGFQGPATYATLRRALDGRPLDLTDSALAHHQRAFNGPAKLDRWLHEHFGEVDDADTWLYLTQLNQAHALSVGVGHLRQLHDRCSGLIWWQLNDCWPAISWSVVDGDGRPKPAWYAARRSFAERIAVFVPSPQDLALALVNDADAAWDDDVHIVRVGVDGRHQTTPPTRVSVASHAVERLGLSGTMSADGVHADDIVVATIGDHRVVHRPQTLSPMRPHPRWSVVVSRRDDGVSVDVTAHSLVLDLCLFADRLDPDAIVDDQLVDLLAGETQRFAVRTARRDAGEWRAEIDRPMSTVLRARGDWTLSPDPSWSLPAHHGPPYHQPT